ncbi:MULTISPECIES: HAMP domain-containing sensor histidine kinase [unclassified Clostridium]|uniref:sensor histidine kinase n=1 Tax=unclassified Clostridium TaxID=2614128 RepID=UPI00207ADB14|nr:MULTISPECIES: HAMP domain-containing sensor histidine kinase [unclassified Clostridium]
MSKMQQDLNLSSLKLGTKIKILSIEFIIYLIYNLYFYISKQYKLYLLVNTLIYLSIVLAICYICFIKENTIKNLFIEYISFELLLVGLILSLKLSRLILNFDAASNTQYICLGVIIYYFEIILQCLGFYFTNKKEDLKKTIPVFLGIFIITFIIMNCSVHKYIYINTKISIIFSIVSIIVISYVILYMIKTLGNYKSLTSEDFIENLKLYVILRYLTYIASTILIGSNKSIIITGGLKLLAFYILFKGIVNYMINEPMKNMKVNLERTHEVNLELHRTLKKRNRILNDTNIMIEKSESNYNKLIDSVYDGVLLFSKNKLQYINKAGLKLLNDINKENIIGISLEKFILENFNFNLYHSNEKEICISDLKLKNADIVVTLFIIDIDENNKLLYAHDVTELNKTKAMKNQLEKYLKEEELKNQFFSNISHELRTPINLIYSAIQLNEIYLKQKKVDNVSKNNEIIRQNSLRLIRTINNFIDTNRVSEGYLKPDFKIYNIVEVVENITIACNKYINKAEIGLIFDSEKEEIYVKCDKDMIERIVLNIISNSVKYGQKGSHINVTIGIEESNLVTIKIENNGNRIDEDTIPHIFDKFTRINKSFNRPKEGSGLGLFLSKSLTELQGGELALELDEKENLFVINFPIACDVNSSDVNCDLEINNIEEKVDIEFSDIYMD